MAVGLPNYAAVMSGDVAMRALGDNFPTPTFEDPAWVTPTPLAQAKVAIVTFN